MGKVIAMEHVTLDGVIQAPARPDENARNGFVHGGWAAERQDPAMQEAMGARMSDAWALLVGRVTYGDLYGYWPKQPSNPISDAFKRVRKYVVSRTLREPLPWDGSTLLTSEDDVARVKQARDENLVVFGSGVLVRSLLRAGLVDEMVLMVHPIVVGKGERLFADQGDDLTAFDLAESAVTGNGVFIGTYTLRARP
ncbi:dihydrofolate reductase family protein [Actinomadura rupiterrae]|uniref:dihydrofolate reductase family protein n=1 Tax=Actinomadura rupiterrae TaxID=559627 RepID=UPI0020A44ECC|nr:dihydrofolate reductase family protein [Actinomadura rupiterrae]MCP2336823.1 dihydrofolate reductase [Actinomadura rupiterrae]